MATRNNLLYSLIAFAFLANPAVSQNVVRFAAVADFPSNLAAQQVAAMIASWNPDFVITMGDNNYTPNNPSVAAWDNEVGQFYGQYIRYPLGSTSQYAPGSPVNRFFPSLGNHDWDAGLTGWYDYFELPGNERYYTFVWGNVQFFAIDSDVREPDGITGSSTQGQWLQSALSTSTSQWKIVYFHHPPFTSAFRGSNPNLQWPFREWGATAVLAGHEHHYERIIMGGFPYLVNGAGGATIHQFNVPRDSSVVRYNGRHGAMLVHAYTDSIVFEFYSIDGGGTLVDRYSILANPPTPFDEVLIPSGAVWKYLDDNSDQGTAWRHPEFNDASWASGPARLGFGDEGIVTIINGGPPGNRHITTYFRHQFFVADPTTVTELRLGVLRDDGAVVYLNGTEVWRTNMPPGPILRGTFASSTVSPPDEDRFYETSINPLQLRFGSNLLAIEVHQVSLTSSDLAMDLWLHSLWVPRQDPPVPVQLGSFTATVIEPAVVRLDWMTLTETNNFGFEIQKSDAPSRYATIPNSFIPGHGTTIEPRFYRYTDRSAGAGVLYYRLKQIDLDGSVHYSDGLRVEVATSVKEDVQLTFSLAQNFPNPFNPTTTIRFDLPEHSHVVLHVSNMLGQHIATLASGEYEPGTHVKVWDARGLASGIYTVRVEARSRTTNHFLVAMRKMLLLK